MTDLAEQATPRPWYVGRNVMRGVVWIDSDHAPNSGIADLYHVIVDRYGSDLLVTKDNAEANAALIVAAVNAYEPMKEALRKIAAYGTSARTNEASDYDELRHCIEFARAALALTETQT